MRFPLIALIYFFPWSLTATITLELVPKECRPGDLVSLNIDAEFTEFTGLEIKFPEYPQLHVVTLESEPVRYEDGRYRQHIKWVFQPMESGLFQLKDIHAIVSQGGQKRTVALPTQSISVLPPLLANDNLEPMALVGSQPESSNNRLFIVFGIILLLVLLGIIRFLVTPKANPENGGSHSLDFVLQDIEDALNAKPVKSAEILDFLHEKGDDLKAELKYELERIIYSKTADKEAALKLIREELNR